MKKPENFEKYYYNKYLNQIRIFFLISIFLYNIITIIDLILLSGESLNKVLLIRYAFFTPIAVILLLCSFRKNFEKYYKTIISFTTYLGGIGLIIINNIAVSENIFSYKYGILLTIIFIYFLSRVGFIHSSAVGILIFITFNILKSEALPEIEYADTNLMLIIFNSIGIFTSYVMEKYEINTFNLINKLNAEKEKIEKTNEITFRKIFENSMDIIFLIEKDTIKDCNQKTLEILGYDDKEQIINKKLFDFAPEYQSENNSSKNFYYNNVGKLFNRQSVRFEWTGRKSNGESIPFDVIITKITLNNNSFIYAFCRDMRRQKKLENKLMKLSYHDQLTGLYNRRFFEEEIKRINTKRNFPISLIIGDVNGLKLINDSFGHTAGDKLIILGAKAISDSCRSDDIISRIGGDEYAVLLPKTGEEKAKEIIKRIRTNMKNHSLSGIELSVSFGLEVINDENTDFEEIFKNAESHMYKRKLFEGQNMRIKTINTILELLQKRDKNEKEHSANVSFLCECIGKELKMSAEEIKSLRIAGLIHDIGKIAISEELLNKPGVLTKYEKDDLNRHSEIGYRILSTVNDMFEIAEYILYHHERWDGKEYPKGLKGEEIPVYSRIISVADAFDSMTRFRTYKPVFSEEEAFNELIKCSGSQFDPELVNIFIKNFYKFR